MTAVKWALQQDDILSAQGCAAMQAATEYIDSFPYDEVESLVEQLIRHIEARFAVAFEYAVATGCSKYEMRGMIRQANDMVVGLCGDDLAERKQYRERIRVCSNPERILSVREAEEEALVKHLASKVYADYLKRPVIKHMTRIANLIIVTVFIDAFGTMGMNRHNTLVLDGTTLATLTTQSHPLRSDEAAVEQSHRACVSSYSSDA